MVHVNFSYFLYFASSRPVAETSSTRSGQTFNLTAAHLTPSRISFHAGTHTTPLVLYSTSAFYPYFKGIQTPEKSRLDIIV